MEMKTIVTAEAGRQDLLITRDFDLPPELLFTAFTDPEMIARWMDTKVLKLESRKYGCFEFETRDKNGNVAFVANGVIHEFIPHQKIVRTFEMSNAQLGVQLEVYEFEGLSDNTCRLRMHVIYESGAQRDRLLQLPFRQGINIAHNRLQHLFTPST